MTPEGEVILGDCLEVMASWPEASVDAIVTDPPYGLSFMGKEWDRLTRVPDHTGPQWGGYGWHGTGPTDPMKSQQWHEAWAREAFRIAKPSAYLLAFGGTRTVHRLASAIEEAGWIIRDTLVWAYAQGFPKSKASLKPAWEPIVMARKPGPLRMLNIDACRIGTEGGGGNGLGSHFGQPTIPGHRFGSGPTAIMGAWENDESLCGSCAEAADSPARPGAPATRGSTTPRRVGQQPNDSATSGDTSRAATGCSHGTTAASAGSSSSIAESGKTPTGLFLPDTSSTISTRTSSTTGSRTCICCGGPITPTTIGATRSDTETEPRAGITSESTASVGRWPSNVLLTDPIFDGDVAGVVGGGEARSSGEYEAIIRGERLGPASIPLDNGPQYGDSGTYSRFFLVPKADRSDREPVLGGLPRTVDARMGLTHGGPGEPGKGSKEGYEYRPAQRANVHPTVKPTELMRHLVRLVTPPGGLVLDPFLGSGTTALAAEQEGFRWVGIEREPEYVDIARARLNGTQRGLGLGA